MTVIAWILFALLLLSVSFSVGMVYVIVKIFKAIKTLPEEQRQAVYEVLKQNSITIKIG